MAFCSFSGQQIEKQAVLLDNTFLRDFLPILPEHCMKVYLYGLYQCHNPNNLDNNLESFMRVLNLSEEDIISEFTYLQELGLVQLLHITPLEVRYLPANKTSARLLKYNKDKYASFNIQAQEILKGRTLTPAEFDEYYYTMESFHMEPDALVMIIKYCADQKGENVGHRYITTVAKNWAYEGITTCEKVEERLQVQTAMDSDAKLILKALGLKRSATSEDYNLFLVWTNQLGFELPVLIFVATLAKNKGGMQRMDYLINKFFKLQLLSKKEIEDYLAKEDELYRIAKEVCKNLGVRYDNLEVVLETYITPWSGQGYDFETLRLLSKHAFVSGIRTLPAFAELVSKFYKQGLITVESIDNHLALLVKTDEKIKAILEKLGIVRMVNNLDRANFHTWFFVWQINEPLFNYALSVSADKIQPLSFLNKLLAEYHNKNISSVEQAKQVSLSLLQNGYAASSRPAKTDKRTQKHEYTKEELNSLFSSVEEVEL